MSNILIGRVPIAAYGLWLIRADHLMLTYRQDPLDTNGEYQDRWWVLEGTRDLNSDGTYTVGVDGADRPTTLSEANGGRTGADLRDVVLTPWQRGSHVIETAAPLSAWATMASTGREIEANAFPYYVFNPDSSPLPTANSSSVVASLLFYIGVDIANNMPSQTFSFALGMQTLLGTTQDDDLTLMWSFDTILGGAGNDRLRGRDIEDQQDKLYGGLGDDVFSWSTGSNRYFGGQPGIDYADDGEDRIDYFDIGTITIERGEFPFPHRLPDFVVTHDTGVDRLYSVDVLVRNPISDTVIVGEGVVLDRHRLELRLDGEDGQSRGDELDFSGETSGLMLAQSDTADVMLIGGQAQNGAFADGGMWVRSLEWLTGSSGDDRFYAGGGMRGIEGGLGNDVLSGRSVTPLTGASPLGYDVELYGGEGNDTLISGSGRSLAVGGAGADTFVLSSLSESGRVVEFVIDQADSFDRLFVPFNFIVPESGGFEGSELFPILGAIAPTVGGANFANLPQNPGPGVQGGYDAPGYFYLAGLVPHDGTWSGTWGGAINISDLILFNRDGADLLIHVWIGGEVYSEMFLNNGTDDFVYQSFDTDPGTETVIRVVNFQEGMLGIRFYELGEESPFGGGTGDPDPAKIWNTAQFTQNDVLLSDPLAEEPETPIYDRPSEGETDTREELPGTEGDDDLIASAFGPSAGGGFTTGANLSGGGGNDRLTGGVGRDALDGGSGNDIMEGGRGDDRYVVDSSSDAVIEAANAGLDSVTASINHVLAANVEHLRLAGGATVGEGNGLNNRIEGSDLANTLRGHDGNDTLMGGLGNDTLDGGSGDDGYIYMSGDGVDTIVAAPPQSGSDIVQILGFAPGDVQVFQSATGTGIVLRMADGGRLNLDGFFSGQSVSAVRFYDGTVWDAAALADAALTAGPLLNDAPVAGHDFGFTTHLRDFVIPKEALLANDRDTDGDPLTIVAVRSLSRGFNIAVNEAGDLHIASSPLMSGEFVFEYSVSDGQGGVTAARGSVHLTSNAAPVLSGAPLADQNLDAGATFSYTVPADTFSDPDGHPLHYSARLSDGSALPAWLTFDAATRAFSGQPPADFSGDLAIRVTATDGAEEASSTFMLFVGGGLPGVTLTGTSRADVLTGGALNDTLNGLGGNDVLTGGGGNDVFLASGNAGFDTYDGGSGRDEIRGGTGNDIIGIRAGEVITGAASAVLMTSIEAIHGGDGFDILRLDNTSNILNLSNVLVTGIEEISAGGGNDLVTGSAGDDFISGGSGNDTLTGGLGNDAFVVSANAGFDAYDGGSGLDEIRGGAGDDIIGIRGAVPAGTEPVPALFAGVEAINGGDGFDILRLDNGGNELDLSAVAVTSIERIEGGGGNDRIIGTSQDDVIAGGTGNDLLFGGAGNDTFVFAGSQGRDRFDGGDGIDILVGSAGDDILFLAGGSGDFVSIETMDFGGGNDTLRMGSTADVLDLSGMAVSGLERIEAGSGNDVVRGSAGSETLVGGAGQDAFVFAGSFGHDTISDFQATGLARNQDVIDLRAFGFSSFAAVLAATEQVNADSVIRIPGEEASITLTNVSRSILQADDFAL